MSQLDKFVNDRHVIILVDIRMSKINKSPSLFILNQFKHGPKNGLLVKRNDPCFVISLFDRQFGEHVWWNTG